MKRYQLKLIVDEAKKGKKYVEESSVNEMIKGLGS